MKKFIPDSVAILPKTIIPLAAALLICSSWDDHPDKCIGPDKSDYPTDPNHSEGWTPESDTSHDRSESAASHEGTCTGIPDRDK